MSLRAEVAHHPFRSNIYAPRSAQLILDCPFAAYHDRQTELRWQAIETFLATRVVDSPSYQTTRKETR